jgi:hypothetical protein
MNVLNGVDKALEKIAPLSLADKRWDCIPPAWLGMLIISIKKLKADEGRS